MTRTRSSISFVSLLFLLLVFSIPATAQKDKKQPTGPFLKRTTTRHETARLQYGGTVTLSAAPTGSVVIEGWDRNEVDVTATIELQAPTAADLDRLAVVNNFAFDVDMNHIRIITTGTHDRSFMKRVAKGFPKQLNDLPWKIDFIVKMPVMTDLVVDSGVGPISISGVEGALRLNAVMSDAELSLTLQTRADAHGQRVHLLRECRYKRVAAERRARGLPQAQRRHVLARVVRRRRTLEQHVVTDPCHVEHPELRRVHIELVGEKNLWLVLPLDHL